MRLREDVEFVGTALFCAGNALDRFCQHRVFFFAAPKMKSVSENYITEQIVVGTIVDIKRGIELEIPSAYLSPAAIPFRTDLI